MTFLDVCRDEYHGATPALPPFEALHDVWADKATVFSSPGLARITSRVFLPILPVEPRIATFRERLVIEAIRRCLGATYLHLRGPGKSTRPLFSRQACPALHLRPLKHVGQSSTRGTSRTAKISYQSPESRSNTRHHIDLSEQSILGRVSLLNKPNCFTWLPNCLSEV